MVHSRRSFTRTLFFTAFGLAVVFTSCKKDETVQPESAIPAPTGLHLLASAQDSGRTVEVYNEAGPLKVGYNQLFLRVKDAAGQAIGNANISWKAVMAMDMGGTVYQHGCPASAVSVSTTDASLYQGAVTFIMSSTDMGGWTLRITYDGGSGARSLEIPVTVEGSETDYHKEFQMVPGNDGEMYVLALVAPSVPITGTNAMAVAIFKQQGEMEFPQVDGYTLRVDPRMPGMGNHGAPGNQDLTQGSDGLYHGQVGFSMSGYWKINLILENASGEVLCGEAVTADHAESSLNFKLTL
jgi:hypothetical protein